ncbi:MAG: hypothetical protein EZS28_011218 [Streblomastix strix]|uniref:Uncharacterized protein n=1 Tax=Streblomastix strix TaxID=222440 RepID=A0A5J4WE63_9EUKA|nr:MAG: hypothetical protein EZS28_011218 [Streblomastix strix]
MEFQLWSKVYLGEDEVYNKLIYYKDIVQGFCIKGVTEGVCNEGMNPVVQGEVSPILELNPYPLLDIDEVNSGFN